MGLKKSRAAGLNPQKFGRFRYMSQLHILQKPDPLFNAQSKGLQGTAPPLWRSTYGYWPLGMPDYGVQDCFIDSETLVGDLCEVSMASLGPIDFLHKRLLIVQNTIAR